MAEKKGKLTDCNNGVPNMITLAYELWGSIVVLPTGVHYRDQMIIERGTMPTDREIDLPSIFNT